MNIIEIKTGQYYDPEYSEYHFKTFYKKRDIYNDNFDLTPKFLNWLEINYKSIYKCYIEDREHFEIDFIDVDDLDIIM